MIFLKIGKNFMLLIVNGIDLVKVFNIKVIYIKKNMIV